MAAHRRIGTLPCTLIALLEQRPQSRTRPCAPGLVKAVSAKQRGQHSWLDSKGSSIPLGLNKGATSRALRRMSIENVHARTIILPVHHVLCRVGQLSCASCDCDETDVNSLPERRVQRYQTVKTGESRKDVKTTRKRRGKCQDICDGAKPNKGG